MNKKLVSEIHKWADNLRKTIDEWERKDEPSVRHPLVQRAKELANLADIIAQGKKR